ncbi:alpha/beta hydrolase [Massilia sp. SYSU DXS3249]
MNDRGHLNVELPEPGRAPIAPVATGLHKLEIGSRRDSYLYVPEQYSPDHLTPLVVLLHGAGGHAHDGLRIILHLADHAGLILAAPASHESTWDIIAQRTFGPDLMMVDRTLEYVFAHYAIDTQRIGIGGFSDGASYALTLGLANGELFTHVLAFSPGFIGPIEPEGAPAIFISHGNADRVLPVDPCSRAIVHQLRAAGHPLTYHEFQGGHLIPPEIATEAVNWFTGSQ